ncbi:MFS transporter, partial [Burkholderia sp. SIMBA_024]
RAGRLVQARTVLRRFSAAIESDEASSPDTPALGDPQASRGLRSLLRGRHARISVGLLVCGLAWGLANFGFLLWLPVNLTQLGVDPKAASG